VNPCLDLTREFNGGGLRAIVSSGQAVVLLRLPVASKDGDWILRETPESLAHVRGVLAAHGARDRFGAPLDVRWMVGGWSAHFDFQAEGLRLRTDFVTRPPRLPPADLAALWRQVQAAEWPHVDARRLSTWFRDYVFIPLSGRQASLGRRLAATTATFFLIGLWHGAAWTFVAFGLAHGLALCGVFVFRRLIPRADFRTSWWWRSTCFTSTFGFVCLTSLLFRAATFGDFATVLGALGNWEIDGPLPSWPVCVVLTVGLATHFMPSAATDRVERGWVRLPAVVQGAVVALAVLCFLGLGPAGGAPYIYFRF
jgi:hypothetical protein